MTQPQTSERPAQHSALSSRGWDAITVLLAGLVAIPVVTVLLHVFVPAAEVWRHLLDTVLWNYLRNSAALIIGVGTGVIVLGTCSAWLVVMYRFPGRGILQWALLLPLAVPTYVIAYAYTDFLQYAGPVQSALRDTFGWQRGDYWFPEIRSLGGAIALLVFVLYPYVYVLARAAFLEQSVCALEVGRTLGRGPWRVFTQVAVPLARPAIAGGTALALMETLNDFGAMQFFGVDTFTTGIYRTWFGLGEQVAAAQLAACLLLVILLLVLAERASRGRAAYHHTSGRYRALPATPLRGLRALGALLLCATPVLLGFLLPALLLLTMHLREGDPLFGLRFWTYARNSLLLGVVAAALAVTFAVIIAYGVRLRASRLRRSCARLAAMGYAVPGSVIAVGVLIPLSALDLQINHWVDRWTGQLPGLVLTGTIVALIYAYVVRFLSVSYNTVEASLGKVTPNMDAAARTLGRNAAGTLRDVHIPIIRGSLLAAGILVFVDVMKELPATIILRPFNFDTLAVRAFELASDERLAQASTAALAIVLVGIIPVILLSLAMNRSRPGVQTQSTALPAAAV